MQRVLCYNEIVISLFPSRTVAIQLAVGSGWSFSIHWYGIMYVLAFICGMLLVPRLQRYRGLTLANELWLDLVSWVVVGVLVGGRLGFVLLYEPQYFLAHPLEIFAVWEGGMSSHGGFIGVAVALILFCRQKNLPLTRIADIVTVPAGIGLAFGRMGNFINQELYGTVTALPWGISVPNDTQLRHPTQLYEMTTDLLIAVLCYYALRRGTPERSGRIFALFLGGYCIARFLIEFVREQQYPVSTIMGLSFTRGQLYTLPLALVACLLWRYLPGSSQEALAKKA